jgi:hypothetical protein
MHECVLFFCVCLLECVCVCEFVESGELSWISELINLAAALFASTCMSGVSMHPCGFLSVFVC